MTMAPGYCCRPQPRSRPRSRPCSVATPTSRTSHLPPALALYYCNWCSYKWPSPSDNISFVAFIASLRQLAAAAAVGVAKGRAGGGWRVKRSVSSWGTLWHEEACTEHVHFVFPLAAIVLDCFIMTAGAVCVPVFNAPAPLFPSSGWL